MLQPDLVLAYLALWTDLIGYRLARTSRARRSISDRIAETRLSIWLLHHRKL
jgi:hypothetical protein